ncbi:MAG: diacylglycerol kinase family lipid kinase [Clostridia bacterium]|nr:diacylglycerol kinase family lipid kinase [Clostridia bacterium]
MQHIIVNPVSGKKRGVKNLRIVEALLKEAQIEYEVHTTTVVGEAEKIVRELTERGENDIIVLGGDGTLHEVLNGISNPAQCRLALIPSGTGNDFAEKLGIPLKAAEAVKLFLKKDPKEIDYLQVGNRRCMNVAGLGMDVEVLERCQRGKMRGKLKYFISLLKTFFVFKGYAIVVRKEDGTEEKHDALLAAVCNGSQFGGGIPVCPPAEVNDGLMNVMIVDHIKGKWKLVKALLTLMKGKLPQYERTTHFLCESVRFEPLVPCTVQLDGELYPNLPFDVKIGKGLKMYY